MDTTPNPTPTPRRRDLRRLAEYLHLGKAMIVLLSALLGFLAHQVPDVWGSPATHPPTAAITSPADTAVRHELTLSGTYADLPPGMLVWAATQDESTLRYYPQDRPCAVSAGHFNCGKYYVGSQDAAATGTSFKIEVLIVSASAANAFAQYQISKGGPLAVDNPGLDALPEGVIVLADKEVVRI